MSAISPQHCPRCDVRLPEAARFCAQCGTQVSDDETAELPRDPALEQIRAAEAEFPEQPGGRPRASVHRVNRRPLGADPIPVLGALTLIALLLSIVMFATVGWIPGVGLLVVAAAVAGLFVTGLRQQPKSSAARLVSGAGARTRDLARFGLASGRTWSRTTMRLASLRLRRARLRRELHQRLAPLGKAVHEDDAARVSTLKSEVAELQGRLDETARVESSVRSAAESQLERERAPVQSTEVFTPVDAELPDQG